MTDERKYKESEVKEIFDFASNSAGVGRPPVSDERGLTLTELQDVGLEVGIRRVDASLDYLAKLLPPG